LYTTTASKKTIDSQNLNFQSYFICKDNTTAIVQKAEEQNIEDSIDRIEVSTRKWNIQPFVFRLKPEAHGVC
jgi:hypothetical protein